MVRLPVSVFSVSGVPTAIRLPSRTMPRRWHLSASSITWVVTNMVVPPRLKPSSSSQMDLRSTGSMPTVGSSRINTSGWCIKAMARDNRRFMPPE
ncbi:hypothetical protein D3C71_1653850 [compost metagenome]